MAYIYSNQKDVKNATRICTEIIKEVQKIVKDCFTFDIRIIGSGERRLVTQNGKGKFDLDYNLILQKDKRNLLNNPNEIKDIFLDAFKSVFEEHNTYGKVEDSTSVITISLNKDFSFDVAIIVEADDGFMYRIIKDNKSQRYIWNQVKNSKNYFERYKVIKNEHGFEKFKELYLKQKNFHLKERDGVKSFSIFLETLNEMEMRHD